MVADFGKRAGALRQPASASLVLVFLFTSAVAAQVSFEQAPINYSTAPVNDPVSRLQQGLESGRVTLTYTKEQGYLKSVLKQLNISPTSQVLVFSKTSFQLRRINPHAPRAIYFGDDVYVGWVRGSDTMELSAVDPDIGAVFYTLRRKGSQRPELTRQTDTCLQCHSSTLTQGVPGQLVRSVYADTDGQRILSGGTYLTDHTSPLSQRWGGWFVTGTHGRQRHMGNLLLETDDTTHADVESGANVTDLSPWFETSSYLTRHSDIVALMVLEHQTQMQNRITKTNFLTRVALRDRRIINEMLEQPADAPSVSTSRRIERAGDALLDYLLFTGEVRLTDPIQGTSGFARQFTARGPRDRQGRSLRDLDLTTRLLKYPCSYLIYSDAFDHLPAPVREYVYKRLWEVLTGKDQSAAFAHLTATDRAAILRILRETKSGLPPYWHD